MNTRALRHRTPPRSGATPRPEGNATVPAAPTTALPKAAAVRLARLGAADMPWLGQGEDAMLAGYEGPEIGGVAEYPTGPVKRR